MEESPLAAINPRTMDASALAAWLEEHGHPEAGAAALEFPLTGSDFSEMVEAGEGKGALEELGVEKVLQRHKLVKAWQQLLASVAVESATETEEEVGVGEETLAVKPSVPSKQSEAEKPSLAVFFR